MIVALLMKPTLSGVYELANLRVRVYDFLKFFQAYLEISIQLRLEAYPRIFPWMLEALSLLKEAMVGAGDVLGKRRG